MIYVPIFVLLCLSVSMTITTSSKWLGHDLISSAFYWRYDLYEQLGGVRTDLAFYRIG